MHARDNGRPPRLFLSYAHRNAEWRDRFMSHLGPLVTQGTLEVWQDEAIEHGEDWFERIAVEIGRSRFAVLLMTPAFLESDFVRTRELPHIEAVRARSDLIVYPWVCEPCGWADLSMFSEQGSRIQCRPAEGALATLEPSAVDRMLSQWAETLAERALGLAGRPRLEMQREEAENAFRRGTASLAAQDYASACASFEEAERLVPGFADSHYFHALALLRGRRAKKVNRRTITGVETHLAAAIQARGSFHDFFLLGLLKWDYYAENRLRMPPPTTDDLLAAAIDGERPATFSQELLDETFRHTPWIDNAVTRWLSKEG